jgi:serine/threonine protein kinase
MYMAPELWFPSNIEPDKNKVVVFSLGVSFYYWVTGEYPFAKADYYNKHYRFLITDPKRFWSIKQQDLGKEIPDEVKKVITGMLDPNPMTRTGFQSF